MGGTRGTGLAPQDTPQGTPQGALQGAPRRAPRQIRIPDPSEIGKRAYAAFGEAVAEAGRRGLLSQDGSTRDIKVTRERARALAEDYRVSPRAIYIAFRGEPMKMAMSVTRWAYAQAEKQYARGIVEPYYVLVEGAIINWAKQRGRGAYADSRLVACEHCGGRQAAHETVLAGPESLTFFEGDRLCLPCAQDHGEA